LVTGINTTGAAVNVTIVDSVAADNSGNGIFSQTDTGRAATAVMVRDSAASNNANAGFVAAGTSTMRLARSVATANGTGVIVFSTVQSYGDNDINGNGTDVSGTLTPVATR